MPGICDSTHLLTEADLFHDVLYTICNQFRTSADAHSPDTIIGNQLAYAKEAFGISDDQHNKVLNAVIKRDPPELYMIVEVIQSKLIPNGNHAILPDMSVRLRLKDDTKKGTIWNHPLHSKQRYISQEIKDRVLNNTSLQIKLRHDKHWIGCCKDVSLKEIYASGYTTTIDLNKLGKSMFFIDVVPVQIHISSRQNQRDAIENHNHLLQILFEHEMNTSVWPDFCWDGKFGAAGHALLLLYSAQIGMSATIARWSLFTEAHGKKSLSFVLFGALLDQLSTTVEDGMIKTTDLVSIRKGMHKVSTSCLTRIRMIATAQKVEMKLLDDVLRLLPKMFKMVQMLKQIPLIYPTPSDFNVDLRQAIGAGARDWFEKISQPMMENISMCTDDDKLQRIEELVEKLIVGIQSASETFDGIFQNHLGYKFKYARINYELIEYELINWVKPIVEEMCNNMKDSLILPKDTITSPGNEELNKGQPMFIKLLFKLQEFTNLGIQLSPTSRIKIAENPQWFEVGLSHYLDANVHDTLIRIKRAVSKDSPVDDRTKHSTSAVDTLSLCGVFCTFWQKHDGMNAFLSCEFVMEIADNLYKCFAFYAHCFIGGVADKSAKDWSDWLCNWCMAINNLEFLQTALNADNVMKWLHGNQEDNKPIRDAAERFTANVNSTIGSLEKMITTTIFTKHILPEMRKCLAKYVDQHDILMAYLEDTLEMLKSVLSNTMYDRLLECIWGELSKHFQQLIDAETCRSTQFVMTLRDTLVRATNMFEQISSIMTENHKNMQQRLAHIFQMSDFVTSDLINQYYQIRYEDQLSMQQSSPIGLLRVKCWFTSDLSKIEVCVLNASGLLQQNYKKWDRFFVRIRLLPETDFVKVPKQQTSKKNIHTGLIIDETFSINLTAEQCANTNAVVQFSLRTEDFTFKSKFYAESYLAFRDISTTSQNQKCLPLSRPKIDDCVRVLKQRQSDTMAKRFLNKLSDKMISSAILEKE